jgi:hypothetical protein
LFINFARKKRVKEEKLKAANKYMWALIDGVEEKVDECICIPFFLIVDLLLDLEYLCIIIFIF